MSRPSRFADRPAVRRAVLWLLALVVALQGFGVALTAVRGPAHVHRGALAQTTVLADFRRDLGAAAGAPALVDAWFGHRHGDSARHRHAAGDASLVVDDASRAADEAAERAALALDVAVVAFVAVLTACAPWTAAGVAHVRAMRAAWQPSSGMQRRLERPPRCA